MFSIVFPAFSIRRVWPDDHGKKSDAFSGPDAAVSHGRLETRGISGAAVNILRINFLGRLHCRLGAGSLET